MGIGGLTRSFLGWNKPVLHLAAERLLPDGPHTTYDLRELLVVVPTRHSGRRLREHLALTASLRGAAVLPPKVLPPDAFLAVAGASVPTADPVESLAVWVDVLKSAPPAQAALVIGDSGVDRDFRWLLGAARRLYELCNTLGENGLSVAGARETLGAMDDHERWAALSALEQAYLEKLASLQLQDRNQVRRRAAADPQLDESITRIVVFGVPDPSPLAVTALTQLSRRIAVDVFVHAPEELAATFDDWGRPRQQDWLARQTEIPDEALHLVDKPRDQADEVARLLAAHATATEDLAIGVPGQDVAPFLLQRLGEAKIDCFSPAGSPLTNHAVVDLLGRLSNLADDGSTDSFSALVRHPDQLRLLDQQYEHVNPAGLLRELDDFEARHLPSTLAEMQAMIEAADDPPEAVRAACATVAGQLERLTGSSFADGILTFLADAYFGRSLDRQDGADRQFATAAVEVTRLATQLDGGVFDQLGLDAGERMTLLKHGLNSLTHYPERQAASVDLEGWLELHWEDAPHLVVTGVNDGKVPETRVGDPFLPDQARRTLGLRSNDDRFARDVYLMSALLESRRAHGSLDIIVGRTSSSGDPLRPSRLLFLCPDKELPSRAGKLFLDVAEAGEAISEIAGWKLRPRNVPSPKRLSVTRFRGYLQCPFRFYLGSVLGMDAVDAGKSEMDAGQFGTACHMALELFGRDAAGRDATDADEIADALVRRADWWARKQFGDNLSAALLIQLEAIRQRLRVAAVVQAEQRAEGWRIVQAEQTLEMEIGGITVSGKLDRIDQHEDGRYRVLDYKSADTPLDPAAAHLARATGDEPDFMCVEVDGWLKRWKDLQLPLYRMLLESEYGPDVECGYFNLPKAVSRTGVVVWDGLDEDLIAGAGECARGVVDAIRNRIFWPPAQAGRWDDFATLFFDSLEESVDLEWLRDELHFGGIE